MSDNQTSKEWTDSTVESATGIDNGGVRAGIFFAVFMFVVTVTCIVYILYKRSHKKNKDFSKDVAFTSVVTQKEPEPKVEVKVEVNNDRDGENRLQRLAGDSANRNTSTSTHRESFQTDYDLDAPRGPQSTKPVTQRAASQTSNGSQPGSPTSKRVIGSPRILSGRFAATGTEGEQDKEVASDSDSSSVTSTSASESSKSSKASSKASQSSKTSGSDSSSESDSSESDSGSSSSSSSSQSDK